MVNCVLVLSNGDIKDISCPLKSNDKKKKIQSLFGKNSLFSKFIETKGIGKLELLHKLKLDVNYSILYYGYKKGKIKNDHELLHNENDLSITNIYGDILVFKINNNENLIDLDTSDVVDEGFRFGVGEARDHFALPMRVCGVIFRRAFFHWLVRLGLNPGGVQ